MGLLTHLTRSRCKSSDHTALPVYLLLISAEVKCINSSSIMEITLIRMVGLFQIDTFVAFISTLADVSISGLLYWPFVKERVTQTWLMRWYWLWLLWQLLIRDWLGAVAVLRWAERNALPWSGWTAQPPTTDQLLYCSMCSNQFNPESDVKRQKEVDLMLSHWGREEIKADQEQHITVLTHHSSIMYDYKAIPQRLPVNGLLCRAEKDMKTEKQEMTGWRREELHNV